jgi:putative hemolysin
MLASIGTEVLIIFGLILANGFFAAAEIALVSARHSRLEMLAKEGSLGARQALQLTEHSDRLLATIQVGITLIGTFSAAFGGAQISGELAGWLAQFPVLAPYAETIALLIVVALLTYFSLVLGELVPKRLALRQAEPFAVFAAPVVGLLQIVARPLVSLLTFSVNSVVGLLRMTSAPDDSITSDDIVYMVREGAVSGSVESEEAQLIHRVFAFTDRPVTAMMTPRTQMAALNINEPLQDMLNLYITSGYSRLPVYADNIDQIQGILYIKDLLPLFARGEQVGDIKPLLRPAQYVVESAHADDVLALFRQEGAHMAIVIDQYGQVNGLVTLEDLLEELVGDIRDEYDQAEIRPYVQREDGSWLVDALQPFDKVSAVVGLDLPHTEEITTLAGLIIERLGRLPQEADSVKIGDFILEVVDMDGRRIDKVLIRRADGGQSPAAAP